MAAPELGPPPPGQERETPPPNKSGRIPFTIPSSGVKAETQYWIWGDLSSGKTPLVCLHGGPGMLHDYILPIALVAGDFGFPVIMYDQIGCGQSTLVPHTKGDFAFWTPQLFMTELENLLENLSITTYNLLGQSWGGMLAAQFAIERQPRHLHKLIISNSPASMALWSVSCNRLRSALPKQVQDTLTLHETNNTTSSKEYEAATFEFYKRHVCRVWPFPKHLLDTLEGVEKDPTVYHTMNGPSEFTVVGNLRGWSVVEKVGEITETTAPGGVLLVNGAYDEATDEVVEPFFQGIKARVKWVRFGLSSHTPFLEETEGFVKALGGFLEAE